MCRQSNARRNWRMISTNLWRIKTVLKRDKSSLLKIYLFPLVVCVLIISLVIDYKPDDMQLVAVDYPFVTSTTPNALDNNFYDASSGFNTPLELLRCTQQKYMHVGLVKDGGPGDMILDTIFYEINTAYMSAVDPVANEYYLLKRDFSSTDEMYENVQDKWYYKSGMCFALEWKTFDPENNKFDIDISYNYNFLYSSRHPQTTYQDAKYSQRFIRDQGQTGFLQLMTSVTNNIIKEVYKVPQDDYNFQVMYMPMDTPIFHNDVFGILIIGSMLPVVFLAIINLSGNTVDKTGDANFESVIKESLARAGMRKNVEMWIQNILTLGYCGLIYPFLIWMVERYIFIDSMSIQYFVVVVILFILNYVTQVQVINFVLKASWAKRVNQFLQVLTILILIYSSFAVESNPWFTYCTAILPVNFLSTNIRFGLIAHNKAMYIDFGEDLTIIGDNDLNTVMLIAIGFLAFKVFWIIYFWPIEISKEIGDNRSSLYLFQPSYWRSWCSNKHVSVNDDQESDQNDLDETAEPSARLLGKDEHPDDIEQANKSGPNSRLTEEERKMVESGDYESLTGKESEHVLLLEDLTKTIGGTDVVDHLNLTIFKDEIFVLIGENGAGKSTTLSAIAGDHSGLKGDMNALGFDIKNNELRFTDNLMNFANQDGYTIHQLTVEETIEFYCRFKGIEDRDLVIKAILSDFDLQSCSNIVAQNTSKSEKKKLNVALAMIGDSKIILLDEPTAGLDIVNKRQIWNKIIETKKNKIIVVSTQDMQEAQALGDRIGLLIHGKLKKVGSPAFFKTMYLSIPSLVFSFKNQDQHFEREAELKKTILNACMPDFRDQVAFRWNTLDQLLFKLPENTSWENINKYVDIDSLIDKQGDLYETVQVKKPTLNETFIKITQNIDETSTLNNILTRKEFEKPVNEDGTDPNPKITWYRTLKAMIDIDFRSTIIWVQLRAFASLFFITILQQSFAVVFMTNQGQPSLNYSSVGSIFGDDDMLPLMTHANTYTPDGVDTSDFFKIYKETQNSETDQVDLMMSDWMPHSTMTVKETLDMVAFGMNDTSVETSPMGLGSTQDIIDEALGAYYIYNMDMDNNQYSIAVYGKQSSAAAVPTYGATILQSIAQKITQKDDLEITFNNAPLPINTVLYPSTTFSVASLFGMTMLSSATLLMVTQIEWHGRSIESGFYHAMLIKGGFRTAYTLSKYIKDVTFNLMLVSIFNFINWCFKLEVLGALPILVAYALVNPFFIYSISYLFTQSLEKGYKLAQAVVTSLSAFIAVIHFLNVRFLITNSDESVILQGIKKFFEIFYPIDSMANAIENSYLYRRVQRLNADGAMDIDLDPFEDKDSYVYSLLQAMAGCLAIWGTMLIFTMYQCSLRGRQPVLKSVKPLDLDEKSSTEQKALDVHKENNLVSEIMKIESKDNPEYSIVVKDLQCWKGLRESDVGPFNQHSVIVRQGIRKIGVFSVKGVSFHVKKGERFVILGSPGCGKTSMLQNITGLERILSGEIRVEGLCTRQLFDRFNMMHGLIGYQPQKNNIDVDQTVKEHLALFANLAGVCNSVIDLRVNLMVSNLGLKDFASVKAGALSEGFKRRLTLGMALIGRPKVVILDDPLMGVDPASIHRVLKTIREETQDNTLLVCTQNIDVAEALASRMAIMHKGKIKAVGTIGEIMNTHGKGYTIELQIDLAQLFMTQLPKLDTSRYNLFLNDEKEAVDLLKIMQDHLEIKGMEQAINFVNEFAPQSMFSDMHAVIAFGESYPLLKFMREVLVQNLALTVINSVGKQYSMTPKLNSIQSDLVRLTVNTRDVVSREDFSESMKQLVERLPIESFTMNETTLDQVFSKMVQRDSEHAPKTIERKRTSLFNGGSSREAVDALMFTSINANEIEEEDQSSKLM